MKWFLLLMLVFSVCVIARPQDDAVTQAPAADDDSSDDADDAGVASDDNDSSDDADDDSGDGDDDDADDAGDADDEDDSDGDAAGKIEFGLMTAVAGLAFYL